MEFNVHAPPKIEICAHTGKTYVLDNHIAVNTTRSLSNPFASGQINILGHEINGLPWDEVLTLHDLVKISYLSRDGNYYQDGIYLISSVSESYVASEISIEESLSISIVSVGKALIDYTIMYHPWLAKRSNIAGLGFLVLANGNFFKGNPNEIVEQIFNTFLNDDFQFVFSDGRKIGDVLKLVTTPSVNSLGSSVFANTMGASNVWETMKEFSDVPWHEMFVDVPWETLTGNIADGQSGTREYQSKNEVIYHRPTPYDPKEWEDLYNQNAWGFDLDYSEISGEMNTSIDESGIKTFFFTCGHNPYSALQQVALARNLSGAQIPRYDGSMIRRFGFRKLEHKTLYISFSSSKQWLEKNRMSAIERSKVKVPPKQSAKALTDMLVNRTRQQHLWFGYPNYFSGVLPVYGRIGPSREHGIRVGGIINDKEKKRQYYITQVSQEWNLGGKFLTKIGVQKGHNPQRRRVWWNQREKEALISASDPEFQNRKGVKFE